jgi:hypothetical protein
VEVQPEHAAIAAMWSFITAGLVGAVKYLAGREDKCKVECQHRVERCESKIDKGADAVLALNEVLQRQVEAHEATIKALTASEKRGT